MNEDGAFGQDCPSICEISSSADKDSPSAGNTSGNPPRDEPGKEDNNNEPGQVTMDTLAQCRPLRPRGVDIVMTTANQHHLILQSSY
ncbi:hypothetical protein PGT21_008926 [Puccinia graminis f. sp. tritici]|uniref:Uncharacterized protein n=1 Tax=Puccinia graminis f. sp. tritici TaxID=56615 RepID=A0A5B0QX76_PUCGR|nr:hypothetical protein PGT21_008926 [Puccinia graminis f. sp. tritici]